MIILGISAYYHDSAAALIVDDKIIAAAQEERFTRVKNDERFPKQAIEFCLNEYGIGIDKVDKIVFYEKPWLKFQRILDTTVQNIPKSLFSFNKAMKGWLGKKLNFRKLIEDEFKDMGFKIDSNNILFSEHHLSHAASAFYTSPFKSANVLTIDGVGEWETLSCYHFTCNTREKLFSMHFPESLGIFYSCMTYFCGFKVNSGEYKLMGLAPYSFYRTEECQQLADKIKKHLIKINEDGSINLNLDYFTFHYSHKKMIHTKKWEELFKIPIRSSEDEISYPYSDLALATQIVLEEILLKIVKHTTTFNHEKNLCLAGGVALNCVANSKIIKSEIYDDVFIHSAAGDAGGALGAALAYNYEFKEYTPTEIFNPYLGPSYTDSEILKALNYYDLDFQKINGESLEKECANSLKEQKIIGLFQDKMEWGPRALGNRSIIALPTDPQMQKTLNLKIKFRESFRPFAPSVLEENFEDYFSSPTKNRYMLTTADVSSFKKSSFKDEFPSLQDIQSTLPAITHLDGSARVQCVNKSIAPKYHKIIEYLKEFELPPVIINTSFNVRGEPIVCSPKDAIECFLKTEMDELFIGNYKIIKNDHNRNISKNIKFREFGED